MKKIFFTILIIALVSFAKAQIQTFKLTPFGFINSADSSKNYVVINIDGKSKAELYKNSLIYFSKMYVSAKDVISTVEGESMSLNGVAKNSIQRTSIHIFSNNYTLNLEFKDGKIKVSAPSFRLTSFSAGHEQTMHLVYGGVSFDGSDFGIYNKKGGLKYEKTKYDLENFFNDYLANLQAELQKKQEDW